jgi:hypothetical protein
VLNANRPINVLARAQILEPMAWTPPTLVGTRMFVRDRKTIATFELGKVGRG